MRPSATDGRPDELADTPPSLPGLQAALELTEGLSELFARGPELLDAVEATFGLRVGQVRALRMTAEGAGTVDDAARLTGEHPPAAEATLVSLRDAGLVEFDRYGEVRLTEAGRSRVDQAVACWLRVTAHVADELGEPTVGSARAVVRRLRSTTAMAPLPPHRPAA